MEMPGQAWVEINIEALIAMGNTEMTLIHLFGMLTGARIQTILTFRVRHALVKLEDPSNVELRLPVGPGTGIDTKNNKQLVLHIPVWFYRLLHVYALSARAHKRRHQAAGGDSSEQYLFLSIRGAPLYRSKADAVVFDDDNALRHAKTGQGVRQFITERVIPAVQAQHAPKFHYQFHDTRATYGLNLTDYQLKLVAKGEITLHQAREFVKVRMGHESSATTDRYLQYRSNLQLVRQIGNDYHQHLRTLASSALRGLS